VEIAKHLLGENWMPEYVKRANAAASSGCWCNGLRSVQLLEAPAEGVIIWGDELLVVICRRAGVSGLHARGVERARQGNDRPAGSPAAHVMDVVWAVERAARRDGAGNQPGQLW
jgi:hypothetical protein